MLILDAFENLIIAFLEAADLIVQALFAFTTSILEGLQEALFAPTEELGFLNTLYKWLQTSAGVSEDKIEDLSYGGLFLLAAAFIGTVFYKLIMGVNERPFDNSDLTKLSR